MSETTTEKQRYRCFRCKLEASRIETIQQDWRWVLLGQKHRLHCPLCVDDFKWEIEIAGSSDKWVRCQGCTGPIRLKTAAEFGWFISLEKGEVFCPWCIELQRAGDNEPLPLSCLPKSQEFQDPTQSKGGIPIWLQGLVLMGLFISTGLFWIPLALSLALVYTGMVIWRRYEKRKTANLPHQKRRGAE